MSAAHCCGAPRGATSRHRGVARRFVGVAEWAAPAAVLALLPKCPICVAAYVALATGVSLSMPVATFVRTGLLVLCVASLTWVAARHIYRSWAA